MEQAPFSVERLDRTYDRAAFSSGVEPLDRYLKTQSLQDVRRNLATPFVLIDHQDNAIAGYYTLSATGIVPSRLPDELTRGLPAYDLYPATRIGRLAVDQRYRGRKLGSALLADAAVRAYENRQVINAMAIVVDAKDDTAAAFYAHHGFVPFRGHPHTLYLLMATMKARFGG